MQRNSSGDGTPKSIHTRSREWVSSSSSIACKNVHGIQHIRGKCMRQQGIHAPTYAGGGGGGQTLFTRKGGRVSWL